MSADIDRDPPTPMPGDGAIDLQAGPSRAELAIATGLLLLVGILIALATYVLVNALAAGGFPA